MSSQERGREWEGRLGRLVGGERVRGSGNQTAFKLDVDGREILWSAKHTDAASFSVSRAIIDDARNAVLGPGGVKPGVLDILAIELGDGTMRADLDLMELIAWIRQPPQLIPATQRDELRVTARTPPYMR